MELSTDQAGLKFYTGRNSKTIKGKNGSVYKAYSGLCLFFFFFFPLTLVYVQKHIVSPMQSIISIFLRRQLNRVENISILCSLSFLSFPKLCNFLEVYMTRNIIKIKTLIIWIWAKCVFIYIGVYVKFERLKFDSLLFH